MNLSPPAPTRASGAKAGPGSQTAAYAAELSARQGWTVFQGKRLNWQIERASPGIDGILPGMVTDIILEDRLEERLDRLGLVALHPQQLEVERQARLPPLPGIESGGRSDPKAAVQPLPT